MKRVAVTFVLLALAFANSFGAGTVIFQDDFLNFPNGWTQWLFWGTGNWQVDNTRNRSWPVGAVTYGLNNAGIPNIELNTILNLSGYDDVIVEWYSYSNFFGMSPNLYYYTAGSWIRQPDYIYMGGNNNTWVQRRISIPTSATKIMFSSTIQGYQPDKYHSIDDLKIYGERKSVLSWTGELNYTDCGAYPRRSTHNTAVSFRVKRTDADNDNPGNGYPRVVITRGGGYPTRIIPLTYVTGSNVAGAIYSTSTVLAPSTYTYTYSYEDYDGWLNAVTISSGIVIDNDPRLEWANEPDFHNDGIMDFDDSGYIDIFTTATFRVKYRDDYLFPIISTAPVIIITKDETVILRSTMNYIRGISERLYEFKTLLSTGTYQYSFSAQSYRQAAKGEPTVPQTFEVVYPPTHILQTLPEKTSSESDIYFVCVYPDKPVFEVVYIDSHGYSPSATYPRIHLQAGSYSNSYTMADIGDNRYRYEFAFSPSTGVWQYWFTYKNDYQSSEYSSAIASFVVTSVPGNIKIVGIAENSSSVTGRVRISWEIEDPDQASPAVSSVENTGLTYKLFFGDDPSALGLIYEGRNNYYDVENLKYSRTYYWQVTAVNQYGVSSDSSINTFNTISLPEKAFAYPNPFRAGSENTNIVFHMSDEGYAALTIYSEFGEKILRLNADELSKGSNQVAWDGKDENGNPLFSGSYMCIISKQYPDREVTDKCRLLVIR